MATVYKIEMAVDDFRSLLAKDERVHQRRLFAFDGTSKARDWPEGLEVIVDNADAPIPDVYSCGVGNMLLWGRSLELLEPILTPVAECLPVVWGDGEGRVINILGFIDCLDKDSTVWVHDEESHKRLFIERHAFLPKQLPRGVPFKIAEQRFAMFCADHEDGSPSLPSLIEQHRLTGLIFEKVWSENCLECTTQQGNS